MDLTPLRPHNKPSPAQERVLNQKRHNLFRNWAFGAYRELHTDWRTDLFSKQ